MGLFKRQQTTSTPKQEPETSVVVTDEDLVACDSALQKMEEALLGGSDSGIRSAAREIAWAGGIRPTGELMHWVLEIKMSDPDAKPLDRPWYWLAAIADAALNRSDPQLAGRVGFFLYSWHEQVAPRMGVADGLDCGGIQIVPRDAYVSGLGFAVRALASMDATDVVVDTTEKGVAVQNLLTALAGALLQLDQAGAAIDPDAREAALRAAT